MRWSIREGLDGVCTDDPKRFLEVCEEWEQGQQEINIAWKQWMVTAWIQILICIFGAIFWWKHGGLDRSQEGANDSIQAATQEPRRREKKLQMMSVS